MFTIMWENVSEWIKCWSIKGLFFIFRSLSRFFWDPLLLECVLILIQYNIHFSDMLNRYNFPSYICNERILRPVPFLRFPDSNRKWYALYVYRIMIVIVRQQIESDANYHTNIFNGFLHPILLCWSVTAPNDNADHYTVASLDNRFPFIFAIIMISLHILYLLIDEN